MAIKFHQPPAPPAEANLYLWFDVQDITTLWQEDTRSTQVSASGQTVGAIDNKGTDALVALTQPNASFRPTYSTLKAGANGLPMLESDSATLQPKHLLASGMIGVSATQEQTVCIVWEVDTATSAGHGISFWESGQKFDIGYDVALPSSCFTWNAGQVRSSALLVGSTLNAQYHVSNKSSIIACRWSFDGTGEISNASSFQLGFPSGDFTLKFGARSSSLGTDGAVGEFLIWDKVLDAGERTSLVSYITKKWGITWL